MRHAVHAAILISAAAAAQSDADWQLRLQRPLCSISAAIKQGLAAAGAGVPFRAELEVAGDVLVWSLDIARGSSTCNVVLDAVTGAVREQEEAEENHSALLRGWRGNLPAAIDAALATTPGTPIEARLLAHGDRRAVVVKVFDGHVRTVSIDAAAAAPAGAGHPAVTDHVPLV